MWLAVFFQLLRLKKAAENNLLVVQRQYTHATLHMYVATRGSHHSLLENAPQRMNQRPIKEGL